MKSRSPERLTFHLPKLMAQRNAPKMNPTAEKEMPAERLKSKNQKVAFKTPFSTTFVYNGENL
jgi:hypothetical protein